jgi:hypothetical protein
MESDLAAMVLDSLGLTLADLERAGADTDDLEPLIKTLLRPAPGTRKTRVANPGNVG